LARSVEVLDAADDISRQMDWVLFCHEQAQILYGGKPGQWQPGEPLHKRPAFPSLTGQQYIRWMIEEFPLDHGTVTPRCANCEVSWAGGDPCFVCGEFTFPLGPDRESQLFSFERLVQAGTLSVAEFRATMNFDPLPIAEAAARAQERMNNFAELLRAEMVSSMRAYAQVDADLLRALSGEWTEAESAYHEWTEVEECDDFETLWRGMNPDSLFVNSQYGEQEPVVEVPDNLDTSGQLPIPVPERVDLDRALADRVSYRPRYVETPLTERRRPRDG
jgi:hypothetical protein